MRSNPRAPTPPLSLADIAATVPPPASLAVAQRRLDGLRERLALLGDEVALVGAVMTPGSVAGQLVDAMSQALAARNQVNAEIIAARRALTAARSEHAEHVRARLQPIIDAAETGVADAFAALLQHWSRLDEASAVLRQYGAVVHSHASASQILLMVRKLVTDAIGSAAVDVVVQRHLPARQPKQVVAEHTDAAAD